MGEWISVEDRLPEKEQDVLCAFSRGSCGFGFLVAGSFDGYGKDGGFGWASCETEDAVSVVITHWMQLPPPPSK